MQIHLPMAFAGLFSFMAVLTSGSLGRAQDERPFGLERRVPWTTSRIKGSPDPPSPYRTVNAFVNLRFNEPLHLTAAPETDRLFVVERYGRILSFPNDPEVGQAEVFLELDNAEFYGLAFHPDFQNNGYFYVTITPPDRPEDPVGTRVSRFQLRRSDPPRADPASEQVIFRRRSGGHNGGCLEFGPDGYLYMATGDSSGIADELLTGQDLTNVSGAILRIDVDRPTETQPYSIPADNPFVGTPGARGEIWAYGLRQPWKMTFDRDTGDLWTGNVGQDLWEQIFLVVRGGNYGWSVMEGSYPFRPERERGPTPFVPPVAEHDHAEFRSITGGYVYHGTRLPELRGSYIYGDYDSGKIWMLRYDRQTGQTTENRELVDSALRLVGFAEDHTGELYLLDHMSGLVSRLEPNPAFGSTQDFPRRLSETGLFASVADHRPASGIIPYSVIAPQWADGASKQRYLAVPGQGKIQFDAITYPQPAPGAPHGWKFPDGTVVFETISMEMEAGNPASRRRLETRVLHYEQLEGSEDVGDQYWRGYTYVWNDEQTDAVLLEDPHGRDLTLSIDDPQRGGQRTQTWHLPGRTECIVCHNMAAKYVLGVNTLQMNRDHDYGGVRDNQLRALEHIGLFDEPLPEPPAELPRLVDYADAAHDLNSRARSYLHSNCSHCHRKWGGGNTEFRLLATVALDEMDVVEVPPAHGGFFIRNARIIARAQPEHSVLLYRMAKLGPGRMPRIGSGMIDPVGLELIEDWISSLALTEPATPPDAVATLLEPLRAAQTPAARADVIDRMLTATDDAIRLVLALEQRTVREELRTEVIARATQHTEAHIRDLFERYLPEEARTKRLGNVVRPDEILALPGDVARGRQLFLEAAGVQCRNCHQIQGMGTEVGPDLSEIGKKYNGDRARLLNTILDPSREIEPQYRVYLVQTEAGRVHTGLLVSQDDQEIVLKDAKNETVRLPVGQVAAMAPQQQSLMPELLLRDFTAQQVADLTAFLNELR